MRITKRTNLAMRVLMFCAVNNDRNVTKSQIAEGCNSSENHLGHVVNRLGQLGYLDTIRGRRGGIRLGRPAGQISVGDVFRNLEADVPVVECMQMDENTCPLVGACRLRGSIMEALEAFYSHLDTVTLSELVDSNDGLCRILQQTDEVTMVACR
ncbi:Rrf2 family transcriptional regulator [Pseudoruegeria sp. HB172150]|uniref:RrF2 family transcriptional regulator n=1 Tax=Pseudoruegeria sp. HB172150 TaxID=2721164 RepID=UPI001554B15D|nr:Rrf2 family transcriptional regulator [Pseudoruegeria sp. HB172150]